MIIRPRFQHISIVVLALASCLELAPVAVFAQPGPPGGPFAENLGVLGELRGFGPASNGEPVTIDAVVTTSPDLESGQLTITATIRPGYHIYSVTQPKDAAGGGPQPTIIRVAPNAAIQLVGPFEASPEPTTHVDQEIWVGLNLEEHHGKVTWKAPIRLLKAVRGDPARIEGVFDTQACDASGCLPMQIKFTAELPNRAADPTTTGAAGLPAQPTPGGQDGTFRGAGSRVEIVGRLTPAKVAPGGSAEIVLTAIPDAGWHIYEHADQDDGAIGNKHTLINIERADGLRVHRAMTDAPVVAEPPEDGSALPVVPHHEGEVTWRLRLDVPSDAAAGPREIAGLIGYQVCSKQCDRPRAVRFTATIDVLPAGSPLPMERPGTELAFAKAKYSDASQLADEVAGATSQFRQANQRSPAGSGVPSQPGVAKQVQVTTDGSTSAAAGPILIPGTYTAGYLHEKLREASGTQPLGTSQERVEVATVDQSFGWMLVLGFVGGIILNIMPCVLPVIGLKVFAFIEQAGESRSKTFALNFWYSLGVISIFMVLAVLAVVFRLGWGQLFQFSQFNIAMAAVIFSMGLSFLGVWEIPIPGFIGTSNVADIGEREGYEGAFAKGTITTLLATPCTGPFMGTAPVGVLNRSTPEVFAIFFAIGLGMSSPYLLIGAFPELVRFLPKPGEWMNTFKQVMGFVLIGTVVYLLTLLKPYYVVPTVALLFGLWAACWWIGRVPVTAPSDRRWRALGEGALFATIVGISALVYLAPTLKDRQEAKLAWRIDTEIEKRQLHGMGEFAVVNKPWQPYTEKKLAWLQENQKTVLIDFTADWCPNCKLMEKTVLKTDHTMALLSELDVYTLVADWSHKEDSPEVTRKLEEFGAKQIPLVAIYRGGKSGVPARIGERGTTANGRSAR